MKRMYRVNEGTGAVQFPGGPAGDDGDVVVLDETVPAVAEVFDYPASRKSALAALNALVASGKISDLGSITQPDSDTMTISVDIDLTQVETGDEVVSVTPGVQGFLVAASFLVNAAATVGSVDLDIEVVNGGTPTAVATLAVAPGAAWSSVNATVSPTLVNKTTQIRVEATENTPFTAGTGTLTLTLASTGS